MRRPARRPAAGFALQRHMHLAWTDGKGMATVRYLPWVDFVRCNPGGHIVAAVVTPAPSAAQLARLRKHLTRLVSDNKPAAEFSTAIVRVTGNTEIHCGFAAKADADRFAKLMKARERTEAAGNWGSHRFFPLDAAAEHQLAGSLMPETSKPYRP